MFGFGWKRRTRDGGFLARLRRDRRGNTIAIMAAALIPLAAMIGSGVDMSRAYMAQNRLRQACDAGALAGRRLLAGTTVSDAVRDEATKYFRFNYPQGQFQAANYTLAMSAPATGTLRISTATTIPTTIMKMFGFQTLDITATCAATQDFVNTDIMMVFDVSGSMNCAPGTAGNCGDVEQTGSKIQALRDASIAFYDALESAQNQLHANSLRLRYGFVNYNSAVNVGRAVYAKNPAYLTDRWSYWTRTPNWADNIAATAALPNKDACNSAYSLDAYAPGYKAREFLGGWWNLYGRVGCSVIFETDANLDGYTYAKDTVELGPFLTSTSTAQDNIARIIGTTDGASGLPRKDAPFDDSPKAITATWDGCIEERQTNGTAINGGTATAAPADAFDLDIDLIPTSDNATRWRPTFPQIFYVPEASPSWVPTDADTQNAWRTYYARKPISAGFPVTYSCPTASTRLAEYWNNRAGFVSYVNALDPSGGTYHDLGIIWGARFLSSSGIFKSATPVTNNQNDPDNPTKIRGFSVKKYMIFMTDGEMAPQPYIYSSYGVEYFDGRVLGTPGADTAALTARHLQRFRMACNAAKSKGIDVWVVAFATALTTDMQNCASKPEQAAGLTTNAALIAKFQEIGSKIGSLRLSQ